MFKLTIKSSEWRHWRQSGILTVNFEKFPDSIVDLKQINAGWKTLQKIYTQVLLGLTLFFSMFPFDAPENIRKPKVLWCFQEDQKGILGRKGLNRKKVLTHERC